MRKILSVAVCMAVLTLSLVTLFLVNVSAANTASSDDRQTVTFYNRNASYPAGLTPTKPYKGTMSTQPPKTYGDESKPFTGTIVEQTDPVSSHWADGKFNGTEQDVAQDKAERDANILSVTRPSKTLEPWAIALISVGAGIVVFAIVLTVLFLLRKKKAATPVPVAEVAAPETESVNQ